MPKKKPEEEILEEPLPPPPPEVPRVELGPPPEGAGILENAKEREEKWQEIDSEVSVVRDDYIKGKVGFVETIDKLIVALNTLKAAEAPGLKGLGEGPEMIFPGPGAPPPPPPPEEPIV